MSKTLAFPLSLTARGGLRTETTNTETLIFLGVLPTGDGNPFDIRDGLVVPDNVWESDGPELDAAVMAHVTAEFERLERDGRAILETIERAPGAPGEAIFVINWTDLESGQSKTTVLPDVT